MQVFRAAGIRDEVGHPALLELLERRALGPRGQHEAHLARQRAGVRQEIDDGLRTPVLHCLVQGVYQKDHLTLIAIVAEDPERLQHRMGESRSTRRRVDHQVLDLGADRLAVVGLNILSDLQVDAAVLEDSQGKAVDATKLVRQRPGKESRIDGSGVTCDAEVVGCQIAYLR